LAVASPRRTSIRQVYSRCAYIWVDTDFGGYYRQVGVTRDGGKVLQTSMSIANVAGTAVDTRHWIGGQRVASGRAYSEYENSVGTGQMHIWFDRPAGGWTGERR
jgi:hypothetical protein